MSAPERVCPECGAAYASHLDACAACVNDRDAGGLPVAEWKTTPWWPSGYPARVTAGPAGHEHELVVNIDGYDAFYGEPIPEAVFDALMAALPAVWKGENRGSRIELHPTGKLFSGWSAEDTLIATDAVALLGMDIR